MMDVNPSTSQENFCSKLGLNASSSESKDNGPEQEETNPQPMLLKSSTPPKPYTKESKEKFQCPRCPNFYFSKEHIKIHLRQAHISDKGTKYAVIGTPQFECNRCDFKTNAKFKLQEHSKNHKCVKKPVRRLCDKSDPPYFCITCKLSFSKKLDFAYHNKHACMHTIELEKSAERTDVFAASSTSKPNIVDGRLINFPTVNQSVSPVNLEDDIEMIIDEETMDNENSSGKQTHPRKSNSQPNISGSHKNKQQTNQLQNYSDKKILNPVLLKDPKSTLVNFKHSQTYRNFNPPHVNDNVSEEVRVLNIATEQVVDRSIKCVRCILYFKTHKDLKTHLDLWHREELMELNHQFKKNDKMPVKHRCTGCHLSFPTVRHLTKHQIKDCMGHVPNCSNETPVNNATMVEEGETSEIVHTSQQEQEESGSSNDVYEAHTSDAELLTYLQDAQAYRNPHIPTEVHITNIASMQVNDRAVKCIRCNLPFPGHKALKLHLDTIHKQELNELSTKFQSNDKIQVQHKCSKCSYSFPTVRMLTKHYTECTEPDPPALDQSLLLNTGRMYPRQTRSPRRKY